MSNIKHLRSVVNRRLNAAVDEVFELFERTIAEYEEQLRASKEENQRRQKLLDAVFSPVVRIQRADLHQVAVMKKEEHQERSLEITEPPTINQEREELFVDQWRAPLQEEEEMDINVVTVIPVTPKSDEEDGQAPETSQLHESQSEENRYMEFVKTEDDEEDSGGSAADFSLDRNLQPVSPGRLLQPTGPETNVSVDVKKSDASQGRIHQLKNKDKSVSVMLINAGNIPVSSLESVPTFGQETQWQGAREMKLVDKPFICSVCKRTFQWRAEAVRHMRVHTGEKPYSCSVCGKSFALYSNLRQHSRIHTRETRFGCSVCHKRFIWHNSFKTHKCVV